MDLTALTARARRHHGLITRRDAAELGVAKSSWYWLIDRGILEAVSPGVVRLAGAPRSPEQQILAWVWTCGDGALASHRSAAHLWVPGTPPEVVDVTVRRGSGRRDAPGLRVHRPRDVVDLRPTTRYGIPVTNPLRTLVDLGAVDPGSVRPVFERMVVAALVSPMAVGAALARHERPGRNGIGALRAVLADWTMNERPPDSVLEEAMHALCRRHGLPRLKVHERIVGYEVDFVVEGTPVVIECDGWTTHGLLRDTFERDRVRDADLVAAGYVVVRFTWRQICRDSAAVARRLRAVLLRVAPHSLTS